MTGAVRAAQPLGQPRYLDERGKSRRVDFVGGGNERQIDLRRAQHVEIGRLAARVGTEILVRRKLLGVDEDRRDDAITSLPRRADQRHVARVQRAHGRHQPDPLAGFSPPGDVAPQIGDRPYNFERLMSQRPSP